MFMPKCVLEKKKKSAQQRFPHTHSLCISMCLPCYLFQKKKAKHAQFIALHHSQSVTSQITERESVRGGGTFYVPLLLTSEYELPHPIHHDYAAPFAVFARMPLLTLDLGLGVRFHLVRVHLGVQPKRLQHGLLLPLRRRKHKARGHSGAMRSTPCAFNQTVTRAWHQAKMRSTQKPQREKL